MLLKPLVEHPLEYVFGHAPLLYVDIPLKLVELESCFAVRSIFIGYVLFHEIRTMFR